MNQRGGTDILKRWVFKKRKVPRGIYSGSSVEWVWRERSEDFLHSSTGLQAQLSIQQKAPSAMYHSCPSLLLTHQSTGTGLQLKAWVDFPTGMWAPLPRVLSHTATTVVHIKGLLLFLYSTFTPFLLSQQWKSELYKGTQNATNTALQGY